MTTRTDIKRQTDSAAIMVQMLEQQTELLRYVADRLAAIEKLLAER